MAASLQLVKLYSITYILFFLVLLANSRKVEAQSVLLPGDVVIVAANSGDNSFGFIPLFDLETGTELRFSTTAFSDSINSRNELIVRFNSSVSAGTNFTIGQADERIDVQGKLNLERPAQLFAYQKDVNHVRYIFGVKWGSDSLYNTQPPSSLSKEAHTFLELGPEPNQQYFIRNGASGTSAMLLRFVGNASNWRGHRRPFPPIGTSFTLLEPPVIQFTETYSNVEESEESVKLQLSVFEHDGSRLLVRVDFDSISSIANRNDFDGFESELINFTGLLGDGKYEVEIPVKDDDDFEGSETGIFQINILNKGSLGDFTNHSVVISDDETPDLTITEVQNSSAQNSKIEIKNNEEGVVSLTGWSLQSGSSLFTIDEDISLLPGESLFILDIKNAENPDGHILQARLYDELLASKGGELTLNTLEDVIISRKQYNAAAAKSAQILKDSVTLTGEETGIINTEQPAAQFGTDLESQKPVWKMIQGSPELFKKFPNNKFLTWNEYVQAFEPADSTDKSYSILFSYFDEDVREAAEQLQELSSKKQVQLPALEFELSATDLNQSESLDELEGLNLIKNNLDIPISVDALLGELEKLQPGLQFSSYVYVMDFPESGTLKLKAQTGKDVIEAGTPFWLFLQDFHDPLKLQINQSNFSGSIAEPDSSSEYQELIFSVTEGDETDRLIVRFTKREQPQKVKDIAAYPSFNLPIKQGVNISMTEGNEYYSIIEIPEYTGSQISLPLHLRAKNRLLKFELNEAADVPENWEILIEDKQLKKIFKVEKNAVILLEGESETDEKSSKETNKNRYNLLLNNTTEGTISESETEVPQELELHQNYPNPFNPFTTISFYLPESAEVKLSVFNIVGQPVAVLVDKQLSAGHQQFEWDATERPSGMYIYQLEVGNKILTRKMTLVK